MYILIREMVQTFTSTEKKIRLSVLSAFAHIYSTPAELPVEKISQDIEKVHMLKMFFLPPIYIVPYWRLHV